MIWCLARSTAEFANAEFYENDHLFELARFSVYDGEGLRARSWPLGKGVGYTNNYENWKNQV